MPIAIDAVSYAELHEQLVQCEKDGQAMMGEIRRLRAALESLTKDPPPTLDEPDDDAEVIIKMRAIAREALDG